MSSTSEQHENLKREYGSFYEDLTLLLAEDDPMGLVRGGAPDDEYDIEVDVTLLRLNEASSPTLLGQIIYEAFVECFGSTFASPNTPPSERTRARFAALGEKAWTSWQRWKGEVRQE